jgi:NADH-quinone oxidoreductase subunit J
MTTVFFFLIFAAIAVVCAINLVVQTHPIASALSLIGVMGSLAVLYLQLGGEFIFAAQVIVYAGAIMVLFIFVIMLLNAGAETPTFQVSRFVRYLGIILLVAFLGLISFIIQAALPKTEGVVFGAFQGGTALEIGRKLFTTYLLPFEVTSVLILIAIVGAIVLARKEV